MKRLRARKNRRPAKGGRRKRLQPPRGYLLALAMAASPERPRDPVKGPVGERGKGRARLKLKRQRQLATKRAQLERASDTRRGCGKPRIRQKQPRGADRCPAKLLKWHLNNCRKRGA